MPDVRRARSYLLLVLISLIKIKDGGHADHSNFSLGEWLRKRSAMSDLHEVRDPEREPQIDTEGWLFLILAVGIIAAAVTVAYKGHDTIVANAPVSHVVAR